MKKTAFRLFILVSGLFRTAAPFRRREDSLKSPEYEIPGEVSLRHQGKDMRDGEVWMESWKTRPY